MTPFRRPPWDNIININNPGQLPDTDTITQEEVSDVIKSLPSRKSPGADGVTYETIKNKRTTLTPIITVIFNVCFQMCRVPSDWAHGVITLLPKTDNAFSMSVDDYRPISLLLTFYKLFMKVIQNRLMPWIVTESRMSSKQKGSMPRAGLHEHVFCIQSNISDFVHTSGKLYVGFVDIKDAFGSLDHAHMLKELTSIGMPEPFIKLTKYIYDSSTFQIKTSKGITGPIPRHKGIIQGCPYSVLAFEIGIDKWLRWIDVPTRVSPAPVQGYVDDVLYTATDLLGFKEMANKTDSFMNNTGMEIKHRKCAILQGQRSGNNWKTLAKCDISIQGDNIPVLDKSQSYRYLGHDIYLDNTNNKQTNELVAGYITHIELINSSRLPTSAKLEAINTICLPKVSFYFPTLMFTEKQLTEMEDCIVKHVRHWFSLNNSSTRSFFFTPKSKGGLGVINPRVMYHGKYMAAMLNVLNCDDDTVRSTARGSLALHMKKRKVDLSDDRETSFAGYSVQDNKLNKKSKVCWPKSFWNHLFEICKREQVGLKYSNWEEKYSYNVTVDEMTLSVAFGKPFYTCFKNSKLDAFHKDFISKTSQGRVAREVNGCTDTKSSSAFLSNHTVSDDVRSFVCRGRLQLLQCNSLLHLYYKVPKSCNLCRHPSETASHILNGCRELKNIYSKRHNRVVDILHTKISSANRTKYILKDTVLSPDIFSSEQETFTHRNTRPDITMIDKASKTVTLIEVSLPFDAFMNKCYESKFDKYFPLSLEINQFGFTTEVIVLIIGSLGNVHFRFVSGLMKCGLTKRESNSLSKYCSISSVIGSSKVWKTRCRLNKP